MKTGDFDFQLPQGLIAKRPAKSRDASRLLVLGPKGGIEHKSFKDLPHYLQSGDMLVLNQTKVLPARLLAIRDSSGKKPLEITLVREFSAGSWEVLSMGKFTGNVTINKGPSAIAARLTKGSRLDFTCSKEELLLAGEMPLPHYIGRKADERDNQWYQTVYARAEGSIAAPTAGLHFTLPLIRAIEAKGVLVRYITLHVGKGTFTPVRVQNVEDHAMEAERFEVQAGLMQEIARLRASGKRVFAVGTTTVRTLEGLALLKNPPPDVSQNIVSQNIASQNIVAQNSMVCGLAGLFIHPGHEFKAVDCMLTNFHLPRSTPLFLASALCGRKHLLGAYAEAVSLGYRFFSYGDAMLIL